MIIGMKWRKNFNKRKFLSMKSSDSKNKLYTKYDIYNN